MKKGVSRTQFIGASLGAEIAVGAIMTVAFEAGTQIERANGIAPMATNIGHSMQKAICLRET